jgi:hypothetical protein
MRTSIPAAARRRLVVLTASLAVVATAGACVPTPADGPEFTVVQAIDLAAKKDIDGLRGLACAGQEAMIEEQLGLSGGLDLGGLLPWLDMEALLAAVKVDVNELEAGEPVIDGDTAEVPIVGTVKVTFDKEAMRPILAQVLEQSGTTMTDDQLNALLDSLEAYGSDLPVDEVVSLVREDGAWKICQADLEAPTP